MIFLWNLVLSQIKKPLVYGSVIGGVLVLSFLVSQIRSCEHSRNVRNFKEKIKKDQKVQQERDDRTVDLNIENARRVREQNEEILKERRENGKTRKKQSKETEKKVISKEQKKALVGPKKSLESLIK